jgi:hypothetical protein
MADRKDKIDESEKSEKRSSGGAVYLKSAGEAQVKPLEEPIEPPSDKQIHPRRPLPLVPEGPEHAEEDQ